MGSALTDRTARQVVRGVIAGEGTLADVVAAGRPKVVSADSALVAAIDSALAEQRDVPEEIRADKVQAHGAVIGGDEVVEVQPTRRSSGGWCWSGQG